MSSNGAVQGQVTTREASEILGKSIRATIRLVESGKLKPLLKLPGLRGAYVFDRRVVESLAERAS